MRRFSTLLIMALACMMHAYAQNYCATARYDTTDLFNNNQLLDTTVIYGVNTDWHGAVDSLHMEIVHPLNSIDTEAERPFILLIHGGGFVSGTLASMHDVALYFARKGFVAATIDYRLGWDQVCRGNDTSQIDAIYRATQDARASLRYMVANASLYRLDTGRIFFYGRSAGAINCLATYFYNQALFETLMPGIRARLGAIDSSTNALTNTYTVKAIAEVSGGIYSTSLITPANTIPIEMFHGTADDVIIFKSGHPYTCDSFPTLDGSYEIGKRLLVLGECFEFCFQPGVGHGHVYEGQDSFFFPQLSHFFKRVLCGDCQQIIYRNQTLLADSMLKIAIPAPEVPALSDLITIYPTVTSDGVTIDASRAPNDDATVEVTGIDGRRVLTRRIGRELATLSLDGYPSGLYLVTYRSASGAMTKRIMLAR